VTGVPSVALISHGTSSPRGQALIEALAAAAADEFREQGLAGDVLLGHVDVQDPGVDEVINRLPSDRPVVLVPLLLSPGYHVHVDLAEAITRAESSARAGSPTRDIRLTETLGPDPRLAAVLAQRLPPLTSADEVILAAAGSSDERANDSCRQMGELLAAELGRPVAVGFHAGGGALLGDLVEDSRARGARPVLANYLLAPGFFDDLAGKHVVDAPGVLAPPLLTEDAGSGPLVDIVADRIREVLNA
jgi:sirohydrochlorin ferrochelatase